MSDQNNYELCYILKSETSKDQTDEIQKKIKSIVKEKKGQLELKEEWPLRELAYLIQKEKKGRYTFMQIRSQPDVLAPLKEYLTLNEDVLRHDVFRYPEQYDYHELKKRMDALDEAASPKD